MAHTCSKNEYNAAYMAEDLKSDPAKETARPDDTQEADFTKNVTLSSALDNNMPREPNNGGAYIFGDSNSRLLD